MTKKERRQEAKRLAGASAEANRAIHLDAAMRRAAVVPSKKRYSRKPKHAKRGF